MAGALCIWGRACPRLLTSASSVFGGTAVQTINQTRTIVEKSRLKLDDTYPDPWPYKEKGYKKFCHCSPFFYNVITLLFPD